MSIAIGLASVAVLALCLLASFRVGFAADPELLLHANGARVLLGGAVGAALALGGALRGRSAARPLAELEWVAGATGAAVAGYGIATVSSTLSGPWLAVAFSAAATAGGALGWGAARVLGRGSRWTNLGVAVLLGGIVAGAAVAGSYVGSRSDLVAPIVRWLLGDLSNASQPQALFVAIAAAGLVGVALARERSASVGQALARGRGASAGIGLGWLATGLGIGAAGPLAFVGTFVPRAVGALAPSSGPGTRIGLGALAGAATVVAIDTVPRLLVGGYALPFNVAATMLAVPIFLGWNRNRLRASLGAGPRALEALELAGIGAATLVAGAFAWFLTVVVRSAT